MRSPSRGASIQGGHDPASPSGRRRGRTAAHRPRRTKVVAIPDPPHPTTEEDEDAASFFAAVFRVVGRTLLVLTVPLAILWGLTSLAKRSWDRGDAAVATILSVHEEMMRPPVGRGGGSLGRLRPVTVATLRFEFEGWTYTTEWQRRDVAPGQTVPIIHDVRSWGAASARPASDPPPWTPPFRRLATLSGSLGLGCLALSWLLARLR